ncbi:ras gtpase-activating protein sar1 [Malassezia pachydermatis]|uniref:Ras gtpase-activating protein sar1 n=1 Tax=Malassezia pachydermatis TaxID=77020 RepID=A0A0M9VNK7_9BASI|nr:ras gtpase-activating protein sar1 [Malassezia pachydermatis]KOS13425.1 ras gtpase-activating protein sar1 [Malassezia pachydermatis]
MESPNEIIQSIGKRASGKLGELKELRIINTTTQQDLMAEEVKAEFEFLDGTKTKMKEEKQSLQAVLNTLSEHYMYLQSQLDTYKSYLQNVRESSEF